MGTIKISSEKKNITLGVFFSYASIFASVIISFFYTRFILEHLGEVNCSIRNLATSIISYLGLISLGMGTAYIRFRKLREKEAGEDGVKRFNGLFFICFFVFGLIALVLGGVLVYISTTGIFKIADPSKAYLLPPILGITVINVSIGFPLSVFNFIENYHRRFFFANVVNFLDTILLPASSITAILLLKGKFDSNQLTLVITWVAFAEALLIKAIHIIFVVFNIKERVSFKIKKADFKLLKPIIIFSFFAFIVTMISKIHTSTDQIILSTIINTSAALIYSYSVLFHTYLNTATTTIINIFNPRLTSDAIDEKHDDMNKVFVVVSGVLTVLLALICGGFIVVGKEFITIWLTSLSADKQYSIYIYACLLVCCCLLSTYSNFLYSYHVAFNKHKFAALFYVVSFLINAGISAALAIPFGIMGVVIGTIAVTILEAVGMTIYTKKISKIKCEEYFKHLLINVLISFASIVMCLGISNIINQYNLSLIGLFLIKGCVFVFIFVILQLLINRTFLAKIKEELWKKK